MKPIHLSLLLGVPLLMAAEGAAAPVKAVAVIESRSGSRLTGRAEFTAHDGQVTLDLRIEGAPPGTHAVHLHEKGDCSAADASSAGEHWNPTGEGHGRWMKRPFHRGDIGNVTVGEDGKGTLTLTTDIWTIGGAAETDVAGKAIVVHAKEDDFATQPSGGAGGRIGCGVVGPEPRSHESADAPRSGQR